MPLRDRIKDIKQPESREKAVFYAGCLIDFAYPEIGEAVVRILNKAGINVVFPQDQTCCGAPARYSGAFDVAAQNAIDNINALLREDGKYIVSACPTCTAALRHEFVSVFKTTQNTNMLALAEALASKTYDFSSLIRGLISSGRLKIEKAGGQRGLTYHDSCHLKRTLNVYLEPREILTIAGYQVKEMFESDICCGMGGSYSLKFPEISKPILQRKLKNIKDTNTDLVVMDCPGCVMQIRGGFDKEGSKIEVRHIAEVIEKQI